MTDISIIGACLLAFIVVFALLGFLAAVMHHITMLFPERKARIDHAVVAAISTAVSVVVPGARVTRIEERS